MIYMLGQIGDWASSDVLLKWLGWPITEGNRRKLRRLAEASDGRVASGPGSPGYKLTHLVSPEELKYVEGTRTQADRMTGRYLAIMRVWHSRQTPNQERDSNHGHGH